MRHAKNKSRESLKLIGIKMCEEDWIEGVT